MLTPAQVRTRMLDKLAASALDAEDAKRLGFKPLESAHVSKLGLPAAAGFTLPYFDLAGKPTGFYRLRYLEDTRTGFDALTGKKALRYTQPGGTVTEVYLPPLVDWRSLATKVDVPLLITEGELKAACTTKHGIPTIGLGGVWSFQSKKHTTPMLPIFDSFDLKDRTVYIVYDSDAVTNPDVIAAELRLAQRLTERGAVVLIGRIPPNEQIQKVGLDDYIVLNGIADLKSQVLDVAFEYAASATLHTLNKRALYVRDPGFIWDHELGQRISPGAFKEHAFSNVHFWEKKIVNKAEHMVKTPAAPAWLQWEHRAEVPGLTFDPGADTITSDGKLNLWTGWGLDRPAKGTIAPWVDLLNHLFGADLESRTWFERWCAYPLQHPGYKLNTAAAIWGTVQGSGKTLVGHTLMRIYGAKHSAELKDTDLDDERNEWAENKQFVLADDITARGDRKFMRRLMTMITQKSMRLNPKYIPSYSVPDCINYYYTSNDPDALYMDDGDRRFFIWEVLAGKYLPYKAYVAWRDSAAGASALWHHLLSLPLGEFDPQAPAPDTAGKRSMIFLGKSDLGGWVRDLKDNGVHMLRSAGLKGDLFTAKELHAVYDPTGEGRASVNGLARELRRAGYMPAATGNPLHMPDGRQCVAYAVFNGEHWAQAKWKDACEHFSLNRPTYKASKL